MHTDTHRLRMTLQAFISALKYPESHTDPTDQELRQDTYEIVERMYLLKDECVR